MREFVVGGLLVSTMLSRFVLPVLYTMLISDRKVDDADIEAELADQPAPQPARAPVERVVFVPEPANVQGTAAIAPTGGNGIAGPIERLLPVLGLQLLLQLGQHPRRIDQRRRIFHITRDHGARLNDLVKRAFVFPRRDQNARIYAVQPFPPLSGSLERFAVVLRFRGEPHPGITPQGCINARWKYVFAVVPGV